LGKQKPAERRVFVFGRPAGRTHALVVDIDLEAGCACLLGLSKF